jgi:hypothetical protein
VKVGDRFLQLFPPQIDPFGVDLERRCERSQRRAGGGKKEEREEEEEGWD